MNDNMIDKLLDDDNRENIILYGKDGEAIEFEQIAVIPIEGCPYALLHPVSADGIADDEALVFRITCEDGEDALILEENTAVIDAIFDEYYALLAEAGVDTDEI